MQDPIANERYSDCCNVKQNNANMIKDKIKDVTCPVRNRDSLEELFYLLRQVLQTV